MQIPFHPPRIPFEDRALLCTNPVAQRLFQLMATKKTNLCVAADLTSSDELLSLANQIGPHICILKTHIDILSDFTPALTQQLRRIADQHQFLLFEDRKFADIGNTVAQQYKGGIYQIAAWADIINAHILPGPHIISALAQASHPHPRALLLLAEMSSEGNLAQGSYTQQAITLAQEHSAFTIGFIAMRKLTSNPQFVHLTPGIQLSITSDPLQQQYQTPESCIANGSDIPIVGRGIYQSSVPQAEAVIYRQHAWEAYQQDLKS